MEKSEAFALRFQNAAVIFILSCIGIFSAADVLSDLDENVALSHMIGEAVVAIFSLAGILILRKQTLELMKEVKEQKILLKISQDHHAKAVVEAEQWKNETKNALKGLSDAIDAQLSRWSLTRSEKEVALLLLKGLSLKEIASVRDVSEKTARAQSFSIYAKSGLSGRAELSAFFLEDLMLPTQAPTSPPPERELTFN